MTRSTQNIRKSELTTAADIATAYGTTPPRRCQTDIVDGFGECFACNAISGERCQMPQKVASFGQRGGDVGAHNYPIVKAWFLAHPCGTNREASEALGLSPVAIGRHVKRIRAEWGEK